MNKWRDRMRRVMRYARRRIFGYYINMNDMRQRIKHAVEGQGSLLDLQGIIHGTDKASICQVYSELQITHDYLRHYDYLFAPFRADTFSLIEFGCADGASLRMWKEYFPHAQVYGVDLDDEATRHETDRIHVVIGDATTQEIHDALKASTGGSAFIILDDASHAWSDQRRSFELFWDIVSPGGFYVIEDLECGAVGAYPAYPPKVLDSQPFSEYMHDRSSILRWAPDTQPEKNTYHFEHLPEHIQKIEREMDMCIFIPGAVVVRKKR